ncbi:hypothetical protein HY065_01800 [Candidatus Berkelbacteria bacterium]|nr:hypothetical protein [Candidatus Berkelbacteria bacterium]
MIKKIIVTVIALSIIVLIVLLRFSITHKDLANASVSGWQLQPETWSGTVTVTGDTRFALWVTLTITPGTKVLFQKNPDIPNTPWSKFADAYITDHNDPTGHTGYNKSHFDLAGKIIAVGTKEKPIIFTSAQAKPD